MTLVSSEASCMFSPYILDQEAGQTGKNQNYDNNSNAQEVRSHAQEIRSNRAFDGLASKELIDSLTLLTNNGEGEDSEDEERSVLAEIKKQLARIVCRKKPRDS